jgi:hypothetical protein
VCIGRSYSDVYGFDIEVVGHSVVTALASESALLDATKGRSVARHRAGVRADHAVVQSLAHAPDATGVLRPEVGGEPGVDVVRRAYDLILGLELRASTSRAGSSESKACNTW